MRLDSVPPLSRLLVALPATLDSVLRDLRDSAVETLTVSPTGHGADVLATDEDGTRVTGAIGAPEYQDILRRCLQFLNCTGTPTAPLRGNLKAPLDGQPFPFRLTVVPSSPPTLAFSAADKDGWAARRQIQQEAALTENILRRVRQRRGLFLVSGDAAAPVSPTIHGLLAALRRSRLRIALYAPSPGQRVREVTSIVASADRLPALTEPKNLLAVAETGVDLLAFDVPLAPDQLQRVVPLAADVPVLLALRERDTLEAASSLVRAQLPPNQVAAALELAVSVHRADRICPACRRELVLTDAQLPQALKGSKLVGATVYESPGCSLCDNTGARGATALYEVLTWDRAKATPDLLTLDRKSQVKRSYEAGLVAPMTLEARKALLSGTISFNGYLKLLGLAR